MTMQEKLVIHKQIENENREALERFKQGAENPQEQKPIE